MRRPRLTIRRFILGIAAIAMGLAVYRKFDEGLPPRFIIRALPGRIERLRPGMSILEVHEILGVGRSWVVGGLEGSQKFGVGSGRYWSENICRDPMGRSPRWNIHLGFVHNSSKWLEEGNHDPGRLQQLSFAYNSRVISEWPRRQP